MSNSISHIKKRQRWHKIFLAVAGICAIGAAALLVNVKSINNTDESFTRFTRDMDAGAVRKIVISPNRDSGNAQVTLAGGKHYTVEMPVTNLDAANSFAKSGVEVAFDAQMFDHEKAISMGLMLLVLLSIAVAVSQPVPFNLPFRRKRRDTNVRFADVAGAD